jgi:iron complex outermembrane receptor protein
MIKNRSSRTAAIVTAAQLLLLCTLGLTARAQTAAPNPAPAENTPPGANAAPGTAPSGGGELEQVTVTGYLIPRIGEGPQPVATLNQDFIQKQAYQTVNDVLNNYPGGISVQNTQTFTGNSNSEGGSTFSLKSLPPDSTLILIDGFRFPFYAISINQGTIPYVDINSIPLAAIDRIEILKDGGSATYGDDAIAGVVNIITKDDYNGADIVNYFGESQRGDYRIYHLSMTGGVSQKLGHGWGSGGEPADGKTPAPAPAVGEGFTPKISIVATFDYYDSSPIDSIDRGFSANSFFSRLSPKYPNDQIALSPPNGSFTGNTTGNTYTVHSGVTGVGGITANDFIINGNAPTGIFSPGLNGYSEQLAARQKRYGGTVNLTYEPFEWLKLSDHFLIQRNEETTRTPSQGTFFDTVGGNLLTVPANNPFNPFHEALTPFFGLGMQELGPWYTTTIGRTFRNLTDALIQLPWNNWFIEGSAAYGESDVTETVNNSLLLRQFQAALNGTLPQLPGVFWNPFTDESASDHPNQVFYPFVRGTQQEDNHTDLIQYRLLTGGTLWALPSGDLTAAGGLEYRSESLVQSNDNNSRNFNTGAADFAGKLLSSARWVQSIYGELNIPVLGDRWSWPGLRSLQVILDERLDNYSHFGSAAKPKVALLYKPLDDIAIRLTYSEGYIVPTLGQLFGPTATFQTTAFDPVKGVTSSFLITQGANAKLLPESSYGYYGEIVWTPGSKDENSWWHWAKGFTAYIDWFQVELRQLIATTSVENTISANLPGTVIRSADGSLLQVNQNFQNLGTLLDDGIEFGGSYVTKEYSWGKLELDANAAYIYNYSLKQIEGLPVGSGNYHNPNAAFGHAQFIVTDLTGTSGSAPAGTGPDFKLVASIFYSKHVFGTDLFRTGFTLNFESSELDQANDANGTIPEIDAHLNPNGYVHLIGSWTTVDWQISYEFGPPVEVTPETPKPGYSKDGKRLVGEKAIAPAPEGHGWTWRRLLDNTTFTFGIKNIGDNPPPLAINGNSGYQGYDTLAANPIQRFFYGQIEKKF